MMTKKIVDERIAFYQSAVTKLRSGRFDVEFPTEPPDEVGVLGWELSKLAETLERHFDETRKLQLIADQVSGGLFLDEVLERIFTTFRSVIPYNRIGVGLLSDDKQNLTLYWARSDAEKMSLLPGYSSPMQGSSLQTIIDGGQPRILNDLESYLIEHPESQSTRMALYEGIHSSFTCPLIAHGKPVGVIFFSSFAKNIYEHTHQEIFLKLAVQLSLLIEKSRLYQELYEINQELLEAKRMLFDQATYDELTGLYNRRAILDQLQIMLSRFKRERFPLSLAIIDIDFFKKINDGYGHQVGDKVLKTIADCLNRGVRDYNRIGRYGGEEFLIVLDGEDAEAVEIIAERLRLAVAEETLDIGGHQISLTISIGVAIGTKAVELNAIQFIAVADHALYDAKQKGRNRVEVRRIE